MPKREKNLIQFSVARAYKMFLNKINQKMARDQFIVWGLNSGNRLYIN